MARVTLEVHISPFTFSQALPLSPAGYAAILELWLLGVEKPRVLSAVLSESGSVDVTNDWIPSLNT